MHTPSHYVFPRSRRCGTNTDPLFLRRIGFRSVQFRVLVPPEEDQVRLFSFIFYIPYFSPLPYLLGSPPTRTDYSQSQPILLPTYPELPRSPDVHPTRTYLTSLLPPYLVSPFLIPFSHSPISRFLSFCFPIFHSRKLTDLLLLLQIALKKDVHGVFAGCGLRFTFFSCFSSILFSTSISISI